jgi:3-methyladenine DNA glycosylase AlkD
VNYLLDNVETERVFQEIIRKLKPLQNGDVATSISSRGVYYKVNLGASIPSLQQLALNYEKNHLLSLKLWNKQWRETMILATLLEEPDKMTGNQMDFWVRNFQSLEIIEQAVINLFSKTGIAREKAYEYCLGKKSMMKITGLLMIARIALTDKESPDEIFDPFFELMPPLSKDPKLSIVFTRTFTRIGLRSPKLREITLRHAHFLQTIDSRTAKINSEEIIAHLQV